MIGNFNNIKQYVLKLGNLTESEKFDLEIECYINEMLAYTNRNCVCECMELPMAQAIVDELGKQKFTSGTIGFEGNVTSYKEGDMQISLGGDSSVTSNGSAVRYGGRLEGFKMIQGLKRCSD